ncbi:polysaccharide biosynthesis protein, partial [Pseudomonas aeruginosa]
LGTGGDVFLLDMGEPVRIQDLARQMVSLSGLTVREQDTTEGDIEICYSGLRPGEKLYEELLIDHDNTQITEHSRIL